MKLSVTSENENIFFINEFKNQFGCFVAAWRKGANYLNFELTISLQRQNIDCHKVHFENNPKCGFQYY